MAYIKTNIGDTGQKLVENLHNNFTESAKKLEDLREEATAKWIILNEVETRSRENDERITALEEVNPTKFLRKSPLCEPDMPDVYNQGEHFPNTPDGFAQWWFDNLENTFITKVIIINLYTEDTTYGSYFIGNVYGSSNIEGTYPQLTLNFYTKALNWVMFRNIRCHFTYNTYRPIPESGADYDNTLFHDCPELYLGGPMTGTGYMGIVYVEQGSVLYHGGGNLTISVLYARYTGTIILMGYSGSITVGHEYGELCSSEPYSQLYIGGGVSGKVLLGDGHTHFGENAFQSIEIIDRRPGATVKDDRPGNDLDTFVRRS